MACTGWRRSWLTAAKKRDFASPSAVTVSAAASARRRCSTWRMTPISWARERNTMVMVMRMPPMPIITSKAWPPRPSTIRRTEVGSTARHSAMVVRTTSPVRRTAINVALPSR